MPPPLAVRVAEAPVHIAPSLFAVPDVSATLIDAVGNELTEITLVAEAVQPLALVTVTV